MYKGNFFLQTCFVELLMRAVHQVPLGQPQEWRTLYDVVDLTSESWKKYTATKWCKSGQIR